MRARIRLALSFAFLAWSADAMAAEITALSGINLPFFSSKPSSFIRTGNGLFAAALVKFEAGSGNFETGILRNGMSATHSSGTSETREDGSLWIVPVLYRIPLRPPFIHLALGPDFAFSKAPFQNHAGVETALEASQDLGDDYGIVGDLRFREGLGTAFGANGQTGSFRTLMIAVGFQKRLE